MNSSPPNSTRRKLLVSSALLASLLNASAFAQEALRIVVPFPPGGTADLLARTVGQRMSDALHQPVIVDNKPGAGTAIAADFVARAKPDGRTLLLASNATLAINPHLVPNLPYSAQKSFVHVSLLGNVPNVVVTRADAPFRTLKEGFDKRSSANAALSYGSMGTGTSNHIGFEVVRHAAKAQALHVPYKGSAPALTDLLGGNVDVVVDTLAATTPHIKAGKLKPLLLLSAKRSSLMPDIPIAKDQGLGDVDMYSWFGLVAPAGTPRDVVDALARASKGALSDPGAATTLRNASIEIVGSSPDEFEKFAGRQLEMYGAAIRAYGITAEK